MVARTYRALGDETRLRIVEALWLSDRTPSDLRDELGLEWNLLAFHLNTLADAGVIARVRSEGDRRRRYVRLSAALPVPSTLFRPDLPRRRPLFVCTHNAARSQFAAALWRQATGHEATSGGTQPAARVHPLAVSVARAHGLDLSGARPRRCPSIASWDIVISVCDRARENGLPPAPAALHWSVPDPVGHSRAAFEAAFADVSDRVARLVAAT